MSLVPSLAYLLALSSLSLASAQHASSCGAINTTIYPQYINASLEYVIRDPFRTPSGLFQSGSSDWIWNIATTSYNLTNTGKTGSLSQNLWLETESAIDLTSPTLGYTGCGAILHGLTYAATVNGQSDNGSCLTLLSLDCKHAIQQAVITAAEKASDLTSQPGNGGVGVVTLCQNLNFGIPQACDAFFEKSAYVQTFVFASPEPGAICPGAPPAAGNATYPLASWGDSTFSPADMESYKNLTTQIAPLITTMFTNKSSALNSSGIFITQHLDCLRPANVSQGSVTPNAVPKDGQVNLDGNLTLPTVTSSGAASSTGNTSTAKSGAEGLRLLMDWVCLLGLSALFWRVLIL